MFAAAAAIGARQTARDERVFGGLEPLVDQVRTAGCQSGSWAIEHARPVGWSVTAAAGAMALAGLAIGRARAWPLALLAAAVSLATWAQVGLLQDQPSQAIGWYAAAMACAAVLGIRCPLTRLDGIPQLPQLVAVAPEAGVPGWRPHWVLEAGVVLLLALVGLLARIYALPELPYHFEAEMIGSMLMSRSAWSVGAYFRTTFLGVSAGIMHLLPGPVLFGWLGSSVYTIRLVSVLYGFVAIPLAYLLARRLVGFGGAVAATVLMIVAPEQLYWSRIETGGFAPVAMFALITANLGLWLAQRFSLAATLAATLWVPVSRYFYVPCWLMLSYPACVYAHAVLFVRGAWRKAWFVVPLLAAGVTAWIFSLSFVFAYLNRTEWVFLHPTMLFGRSLASVDDPGRLGVDMVAAARQVIRGLWWHEPIMFSQWFWRDCVTPHHMSILNPCEAALIVLGVAYLVGQLHLRRACLLLVWLVFGVLPAIMSEEATTRRLALLFPAMHVTAAVFLAAAVAIVRTCAGPWLARTVWAALGAGLVAVSGASLGSHFAIRTGLSWLPHSVGFVRPLFEQPGVILTNVTERHFWPLVLGNLDALLEHPSCILDVPGGQWIRSALRPRCEFRSALDEQIFSPAQRAALRKDFAPRRLSVLLERTPDSDRTLRLLRGMFPDAEMRRDEFDCAEAGRRSFTILTVDLKDAAALSAPSLVHWPAGQSAASMVGGVLTGVTLTAAGERPAGGAGDRAVTVRGGLLIERDGWYNFQLGAGCPQAKLTIDGEPLPAATRRPVLAGVHGFEIHIADVTACALPLGMFMQSEDPGAMLPIDPTVLMSPTLATVSAARAEPVSPYPGYAEARVQAQWVSGSGVDLGVDAQGAVTVLLAGTGFLIQRFDRDGNEEARWKPEVTADRSVSRLEVDAAGEAVLMAGREIVRYDRAGRRVGGWTNTAGGPPTDMALLPDGHVLLGMPSMNAISVLTREGALEGQITGFVGAPSRWTEPVSITVGPAGRLLVMNNEGQAWLGRIEGDLLQPVFLREFRAIPTDSPVWPIGAGFDGPDRLLIPHPSRKDSLVYDASGRRLVAATPERDLLGKPIGRVVRFRSAGNRIYALTQDRVWSFAR